MSNPDIKILRDELAQIIADNKKKDSVIEEQACVLDEWIIIMAMISDGTEGQSAITLLTFKIQAESHLMHGPDRLSDTGFGCILISCGITHN